MTSIIEDFKKMISEAIRDMSLQRLNEISRTIDDFRNIPFNFITNCKRLEIRKLTELFEELIIKTSLVRKYLRKNSKIK